MNVVPFTADLIEDAGRLLAARHRAMRTAEPALPARFAQLPAATAEVAALAGQPGVAALRNGRLVGYLLGGTRTDPSRGRHAWVEAAGHALAPDEGPALFADLYAALAPRWLEAGCFSHYVLVPAYDRPALDGWFSLCFGMEQVHAIRETAPAAVGSVDIRRGTMADLDTIVGLGDMIRRHQAGAPVWAVLLPESLQELRTDWTEVLNDPAYTLWLAYAEDGRAVGYALFGRAEPDLLTPPDSTSLVVAATRPEVRGRGFGQALARHGLAAAAGAGFTTCITDWRSTNLLSSRFWPRQGFRPTHYRLTRRVDERIAWAK